MADDRNFRSAYYEKVGFRGVEEKKTLNLLLKEDVLDMSKLYQFCVRFAVPNTHRNLVWKILLGVLPPYYSTHTYVSQQRDQQYNDLLHTTSLLSLPDADKLVHKGGPPRRTSFQLSNNVTLGEPTPENFWFMYLIEEGELTYHRERLLKCREGEKFQAISCCMLELTDSECDAYWLSKGFYSQLKKLTPHLDKLVHCITSMLERQDKELYNFLATFTERKSSSISHHRSSNPSSSSISNHHSPHPSSSSISHHHSPHPSSSISNHRSSHPSSSNLPLPTKHPSAPSTSVGPTPTGSPTRDSKLVLGRSRSTPSSPTSDLPPPTTARYSGRLGGKALHFLSSDDGAWPALTPLLRIWCQDCLANVLPTEIIPRVWDMVIGGCYYILAYVCSTMIMAHKRQILTASSTHSILTTLAHILPKEKADTVVSKAIETWQEEGSLLVPGGIK